MEWQEICQNIIKVLTDKGDVDVPDMPIVEQNKYQSVTLAIPDGASYIQFTSEEVIQMSGMNNHLFVNCNLRFHTRHLRLL